MHRKHYVKNIVATATTLVACLLLPGGRASAEARDAAPLTIHYARGLWSRHYRLEEAFSRLGGALVSESWHCDTAGAGWLSPGAEAGGWLYCYDGSPDWLAGRHVVIAANVPAKAFGKKQASLADYVKRGGVLLLLGGNCFATKQYMQPPLAELMPMEFSGEGRWAADLINEPAGLVLSPGPAAGPELKLLDWAAGPRLYWYHDGKPKDGAKVLVTAGGKPVLVSWAVGDGHVAVFAGTVMGVTGGGHVPFWEWVDWPAVLACTLDDLAGPRRENAQRPNATGNAAELRRRVAAAAAKGACKPNTYPDFLTDDHKAYQEALMGCLLAGDVDAAHAVVDVVLNNLYLIARARTELNKPKPRLKRVMGAVPDALAWQQQLYHVLNDAPDSVVPALARAIAAQADRRIEAAAWALCAGRPIPPDLSQIFATSSVPAVRALADLIHQQQ